MERCEQDPLAEKGSIDQILTRIGFGKYQKYVFLIAGMGQVADGIEMTAISLLMPVFQDYWELSVFEMGVLGGMIFIGMILGNVLTAALGDTYGRLVLMRYSTLLMCISAVLSGLMPDFWSFLSTRFFVGLAGGMLIPISASYCTEICPKEDRGRFLVSMEICFVLGMLIVTGLVVLFIETMGSEGWRWVLVIAAVPVIVAYALLMVTLKESPRFLASQKRYSGAVEVLEHIAEVNQQPALTPEERRMVQDYHPLLLNPGLSKIALLVDVEYRRTTFQLLWLWFAAVFTYYGLIIIIPETLGADNTWKSYGLMLLLSLIQLPAIFVNIYSIEHEKMGRKSTISWALAAQTACFLASVTLHNTVSQWCAVIMAMFFIGIWFNTLYPYTGELYHTSIRSMTYGSMNAVARSGGALAPIILLEVKGYGEGLAFAVLGVVSLLAAIDAFLLPYETRNKPLDQTNSLS